MVEHILSLGIDVHEQDDPSRTGMGSHGTPLHPAVASTQDIDSVKLLQAYGASISQTDGPSQNGSEFDHKDEIGGVFQRRSKS